MDPHMTEEARDIFEQGHHRRLNQELAPPCPQHVKKKKFVNFKISLRRRIIKEQPRRGSTGSVTIAPRPDARKNSVTFLQDEPEMEKEFKETRKAPRNANLELQRGKTTKERREAFRGTGEQRQSAHRSIERGNNSPSPVINIISSRDEQDLRNDNDNNNKTTLQYDQELSQATQHSLKLETHRRSIQNEPDVDYNYNPTRSTRTTPCEFVPPCDNGVLQSHAVARRRRTELSRSASSVSTESWRKLKTIATPRARINTVVDMVITRRKVSLAPSIWTPSVPRSMPGPRPANFQDQIEAGKGSYIISFILHNNVAKPRSHRFRRLHGVALTERELQSKHYLAWLSKLVANPLLLSGELLKGLEIGVQFPVIHMREIPENGVGGGEHRRLEASLGSESTLYQGEYEEVEAWIPELLVTCPSDQSQWARCYIILGFMTLDGELNQRMESAWKEWTGVLFIYCNIDDDLGLKKLSFLRRRSPHQPKLFSYIVLVEMDTVTRKNSLHLLDFVYKMRMRSYNGYISVYQSHSPDSDALMKASNVSCVSAASSVSSASSSSSSSGHSERNNVATSPVLEEDETEVN